MSLDRHFIGFLRAPLVCGAALLMFFSVPTVSAQPGPPVPMVPLGESAPGAWPYCITSANWNVHPIAGSILNGNGSGTLNVTIPSQGPILWTESRHGEGDISALIGPADSVLGAPPSGFVNNFRALTGPQTHAWRVSTQRGLAFATVRRNGYDNLDTIDGLTPIGPVRGVAQFTDFSVGIGYNMVDGSWGAGGSSDSDINMGILGAATESSFDISTTYMPYQQGWSGGWVSQVVGTGGIGQWMGTGGASPDLLARPQVVQWQADGRARLTLGGSQTPNRGYLFVNGSDGDDNMRVINAYPSSGGWDVTIREDDSFDVAGQTAFTLQDNAEFHFVYLPHGVPNALAGHIAGATGASLLSDGSYTLSRVDVGRYELTIPGKTGDHGMLMLSGAGQLPGLLPTDPSLADRATLSYEYSAASGKWLIESVELIPGFNIFSEGYAFKDMDFVFTYVDFAAPVQPRLGGDANGDGLVSGADFTLWADNFGATGVGVNQGSFTCDGRVTGGSYTIWADNFGRSLDALQAVPEPAGWALSVVLASVVSLVKAARICAKPM